jgi:transposase
VETASALAGVRAASVRAGRGYPAYIGLDVHKETIAVAVARAGRAAPEFRGEIANRPQKVARLVERLAREFGGEVLLFAYEAGPCGYGLYRQLLGLGHDCAVVAPSLIPRKPGERIKTDRRDALRLAQALRGGDLTAVWVPDEEQEAMRDLTRARDDLKAQERKARQQLNAYVLRHGHAWPSGKTRWTQAHYNWLESLRFAHDWQQVVLQEYIDAVRAASRRVADLTAQLERVLPQWSLAPVVDSLVALRGIDKLAAMVLLAELGDISRFDAPRQTAHLKRKAAGASDEAKAIAWQAQKRLCGRYRTLLQAGKNTKQTTVTVARELAGFIWAIACHEMPKLRLAG